ncbi:MAG: TetR/AcrR family transcriptional regulator [Candidatus Thiodiazotropha sp. 'RUGA']|nr:TetR/AcrR family transcriptional regulator [Candidatus Thiodiazotropha sp. 'RUGA']
MSVGRKRSFDKSEALDKAMRLFWENGYSGTSVSDLTEQLGINKPSLYAAFGNKEKLFQSALERYMACYAAPLLDQLSKSDEQPLAQRIRHYMSNIIELVSNKTSPQGCLFVKSSCEAGGTGVPEEVTQALQNMGLATQQVLTSLFEQEQSQGRLPATADPKVMADYLMSVLYGISVLARQGRCKDELMTAAEFAIATLLPGQTSREH